MARAYKLNDWEEYAEHLLKRFEIMDKKDKLSTELSKGMQQKVSICCGLVHRPEVVIFDEPMVGLDPYAIKELKRLFLELKEDKRTILISTHMIESIEDHWDMAYIMKNGEFIAKRLKDELIGESLEESFFETTIKEERA